MTLHFDLFWSFRSPYSYLSAKRLLDLTRDFDVACNLRPIYPLALRIEGYFKRQDPMARAYFFRDMARVADFQGLPIKWPVPDPVLMSFETGEVPTDQPYIHRLTFLGIAASERGRGLEFAHALSSLIFGGTENWDQGDHMARATASAELDLAEMDAAINAAPAHYAARVAENEAAQKAAGHWGVPLMVLDDEPFFGQDRIDVMIWRMKQKGLTRRPPDTIIE